MGVKKVVIEFANGVCQTERQRKLIQSLGSVNIDPVSHNLFFFIANSDWIRKF